MKTNHFVLFVKILFDQQTKFEVETKTFDENEIHKNYFPETFSPWSSP